MRDPERIGPIVERLTAYWRAHPDLRLGQIVTNAARASTNGQVFYLEDDRFADGLSALEWHDEKQPDLPENPWDRAEDG